MLDRSRATSFNQVASLYDEVRPSYPTELIDEVIRASGLTTQSNILEIGAGTGKGTRLFAARGFNIHCLEPGRDLAAVLQGTCRGLPGNVSLETSRFEDWQVVDKRYDLIFCAQAFHWIDPEVRLRKTAGLLTPGGTLALFWNRPNEEAASYKTELDRAYNEHAPTLVSGAHFRPFEEGLKNMQVELNDSKLFSDVSVKTFLWSEEYTSEKYIKLLQTYSDHRALPQEQQENLLAAIRGIVDGLGGVIRKEYAAHLHLARQKLSKRSFVHLH